MPKYAPTMQCQTKEPEIKEMPVQHSKKEAGIATRVERHHIAFSACATRIGTRIAVINPMLTAIPAMIAALFDFAVQ
jgi:hypothetical protein